MEASGPVLIEISFGDSFKFDFMFMPILFPGVRVDDLRFVEVRGSRKYLIIDLLRIFGDCKLIYSASDNL